MRKNSSGTIAKKEFQPNNFFYIAYQHNLQHRSFKRTTIWSIPYIDRNAYYPFFPPSGLSYRLCIFGLKTLREKSGQGGEHPKNMYNLPNKKNTLMLSRTALKLHAVLVMKEKYIHDTIISSMVGKENIDTIIKNQPTPCF